MGERFPLTYGALLLALYGAALLLGRSASAARPLALGLLDLGGALSLWGFFLVLRILDEHKDFDGDLRRHPERVLQRGLVTRGHLKGVALIAVLVQAAVSLNYDRGLGPVTLRWLLALGWAGLMYREFFLGTWLARHRLVQHLSHAAVVPLALLWAAQMGAGRGALPAVVVVFVALALLSDLVFELTRKLRAPEDEQPDEASATRLLGTGRAPLVALGVLLLAAVALGGLLNAVRGAVSLGPVVAPVLVAAAPAVALLRFRAAPSRARAHQSEALAGLSTLATYVLIIAQLLHDRGARWN
jgi:4-hydroxybenzoate polyprenyltransferase